MKKHQSITILKMLISRHLLFRRTVKRNLVIAAIPIAGVIAGALAAIYMQHQSITVLGQEKATLNRELAQRDLELTKLNRELAQLDSANSNLTQAIDGHTRRFENISRELVRIEQRSEVETADVALALEQRIRIIGEFYTAKEQEYSFIGNRLQQIEDFIGLDETAILHDAGVLEHIEYAHLTASQERIIHHSIPSGFPGDHEVITSKFGMRKHPVTGLNSFHKGIDVRAKEGDPVYATADGLVHKADYSDLSGNRIIIRHNFGFETRYAHLSEMLAEPGNVVYKGDLIGYSGNTGRSNAGHLHYEIRYLGKAIDPLEFLTWQAGNQDVFPGAKSIRWQSLLDLISRQVAHQTLQLSSLGHMSGVERYRPGQIRAE